MASWALIPALTGFHYSAVEKSMEFAPKEGTFFWSDGYAWGTVTIKREGEKYSVKLTPEHGDVFLKRMILTGMGEKKIKEKLLHAGEVLTIDV
jgi:hypothetical protein